MESSILTSVSELAESEVSPQTKPTNEVMEKPTDASSLMSASSGKPPTRRKAPLLVQWPPPKPNSFRSNDNSPLSSCIDQAISTVRSEPGLDDGIPSRHSYHGPSSSCFHSRHDCPVTPGSVKTRLSAIMSDSYHGPSSSSFHSRHGCPVTPGSVKTRLSAIVSAFSPLPNFQDHPWSEEEDSPSAESFASTSGRSLTSSPSLPLPPVYAETCNSPTKTSPMKKVSKGAFLVSSMSSLGSSSTDQDGGMNGDSSGTSSGTTTTPSCRPDAGTTSRAYLKRRKTSKLKKKWPPASNNREDVREGKDPDELQTITPSGFQERRSRFESVTKVPTSAWEGADTEKQANPSRSGSTFCGQTDPTAVMTDEDDFTDCTESPFPTNGVWIVEQGFAGCESSSNFCYDPWATEACDADNVPPPIQEECPYEEGSATTDTTISSGRPKLNRRTSYRISYDGPTSLRLEDVYGNLMMIPEADSRFEPEHEKDAPPAPPSRPALSPTLPRRRREKSKHSHSLSDDQSERADDDEYGRSKESQRSRGRRRGRKSFRRPPNVWITPLKSRAGASRKWRVKRVWDIETIDEEEPEYEIDREDLTNSIQDLLGVPNFSGSTSRESQNTFSNTNKWNIPNSNDKPPNRPGHSPYRLTKFFDLDGEFDGSEATVSLDEGQFVQKIKDITESTDYDNVIEEVEYDSLYQGGSNNIEFRSPETTVCPEQISIKSEGQGSGKPRAVPPKNIEDSHIGDHEEDLDSFMGGKDLNLNVSHSRKTLSKTSELEPPALSRSAFTLSSSYRCPLENNTVYFEVVPKRLPRVKDDEKRARGIPTWQKAAVGNAKERDQVKLWWEE